LFAGEIFTYRVFAEDFFFGFSELRKAVFPYLLHPVSPLDSVYHSDKCIVFRLFVPVFLFVFASQLFTPWLEKEGLLDGHCHIVHVKPIVNPKVFIEQLILISVEVP
jgi:hypothetical protein